MYMQSFTETEHLLNIPNNDEVFQTDHSSNIMNKNWGNSSKNLSRIGGMPIYLNFCGSEVSKH